MDLKKKMKHQELKDLMVKKQGNGHHELALEIGSEALQILEEWQIYWDMGCSSLKLGTIETCDQNQGCWWSSEFIGFQESH